MLVGGAAALTSTVITYDGFGIIPPRMRTTFYKFSMSSSVKVLNSLIS